MNVKETLSTALSQGSTPSQLSYLLNNCTVNQFNDVVSYLLKKYDNQSDLLTQFFQSKSDASVFECTDQETLENDFKGYVLSTH